MVGTTKTVIMSIAIPPKVGKANGTITSAPLPWEVITGISARIAVAVVIRAVLTRLAPASRVASLISASEWKVRDLKA